MSAFALCSFCAEFNATIPYTFEVCDYADKYRLNDALVKQAFKYAPVDTKKDLIDLALREFIRQHERADVRALKGKNLLDPSYDYRAARGSARH